MSCNPEIKLKINYFKLKTQNQSCSVKFTNDKTFIEEERGLKMFLSLSLVMSFLGSVLP